MSEIKLSLDKRTLTGKKLASLRKDGFIPSVVYGGEGEPKLAQSTYNDTEKVLKAAGYHSTIDLTVDGKTQMAIVKNIDIDPVSRRIINVEFQAVSADRAIEATTPIKLVGYENSEATKLHYTLSQVMEEIEVKAKPSDLPKELEVDASKLATTDDKITVADIVLPKGVELADKEMKPEQVIATVYDPAVEAAQREAEEKAAVEAAAAAEGGESAEGEAAPAAEGGESAGGEKPAEEKAE
ncbi:50S ribosomal protein L25 [Candidatus Saccharibacteria bacterium]|nr:50S ribosomal protein L25 [Candidatus Saccharibacteria bacterium]